MSTVRRPGRPSTPMPPAAAAYITAFDAYLTAPRDERDQQLIRELCDAALDELIPPER